MLRHWLLNSGGMGKYPIASRSTKNTTNALSFWRYFRCDYLSYFTPPSYISPFEFIQQLTIGMLVLWNVATGSKVAILDLKASRIRGTKGVQSIEWRPVVVYGMTEFHNFLSTNLFFFPFFIPEQRFITRSFIGTLWTIDSCFVERRHQNASMETSKLWLSSCYHFR